MPNPVDDMLTSIPAWGIFSYLVLKLVLDRWKERRSVAPPPPPGIGQDQIAAVIRDQNERREILDALRQQSTSLDRVTFAMERLAATQEQLARAEEKQTEILEKSCERSDRIAHAINAIRDDTGKILTYTSPSRYSGAPKG